MSFGIGGCQAPAWSPGGEKIAFSRGNSVYTIEADGSEQTRVCPGSNPTWSPDGTELAVVRDGSIYTTSVDGSKWTSQLTGRRHYFTPSYSPRGDSIAFSSRNEADGRKNYVYVLDLVTSGFSAIHPGREPSWSPDGSRLAFACLHGGVYDILTASADGVDIENLTRNDDGGIDLREPAWLPTGDGVLFRQGSHRIKVVGLPTLEESIVLESFEQVQQPARSPSRDLLAFVGLQDGNEEIYVADLYSREVACITGAQSHFMVDASEEFIRIIRGGRSTSAWKSGVELVYGDGGEGLVFLERDYALDIAAFREALYKASTWGTLRQRVSPSRYEETVEQWMDSREDEEDQEISPPAPDDPFDGSEIWGYDDGDWPEFAPRMMEDWVSGEIISRYGGLVFPTLNAEYPVIYFENEGDVVAILEEEGYACTRDDELSWNATWGG